MILEAVSSYIFVAEMINFIIHNVAYQNPIDAANLILNLTVTKEEKKVDVTTILYLLGDTLNRFNSTDGEVQEEPSQVNM